MRGHKEAPRRAVTSSGAPCARDMEQQCHKLMSHALAGPPLHQQLPLPQPLDQWALWYKAAPPGTGRQVPLPFILSFLELRSCRSDVSGAQTTLGSLAPRSPAELLLSVSLVQPATVRWGGIPDLLLSPPGSDVHQASIYKPVLSSSASLPSSCRLPPGTCHKPSLHPPASTRP